MMQDPNHPILNDVVTIFGTDSNCVLVFRAPSAHHGGRYVHLGPQNPLELTGSEVLPTLPE